MCTQSFHPLRFCARRARGAVALFAFLLGAAPAFAQHASENIVATAEDAFGTTIGNETIGLYSTTDARGFSPRDAANLRLEGLYFDQAGMFGISNVLIRNTNMRVGFSAQSYPFPAPSGIADIHLQLPGRKVAKSVSLQVGPFSTVLGEADLEIPRAEGKPGFVFSVASGQESQDTPPVFYHVDTSALMHWLPRNNLEVIAFVAHAQFWNGLLAPLIFTGGDYVPPNINLPLSQGPSFRQKRQRISGNQGFIVRSLLSENLRLQAGLFHSNTRVISDYSLLFFNTQPSGLADLIIRTRPTSSQQIYSGEIRLSRLFQDGDLRHTVHFSARGRAGQRHFGADQTIFYGPTMIDVTFPYPRPVVSFGPQSHDTIRHGGVGVSYVGVWPKVGELSIGLQKAVYRRTITNPLGSSTATRSQPWLYNGTLAIESGKKLTFYAGYTRGLEDTIVAPDNATNPGDAPPATLSKQIDAGLRYRLTPEMTLVAGVFEIKKPYFDRDAAAFYTRVGTLTHRGVEVSLSGSPFEGLKILAGAVLLKARVAGPIVDQGLIGKVPLGRIPATIRLNASYGPEAWHGFSITGQVKFEDAHYATHLNTARMRSVTNINLGARYNFAIERTSASVRVDVENLTNEFAWTVNPASGHFAPLSARRWTVRVAADF